MNFIDYIERNFDCERVSRDTQLKVAGECPFCKEERSDLRLYIGILSELGQCFHCETGFNGVKFVMAREGVSAKVAIKILNGEEDGYLRAGESEETVKTDSPAPLPETIDIDLSVGASRYLNDRGMSADIINHFELKFCQKNLVIGDETFWTKNRIIIPIKNMAGETVSWQGRDITGRSKIRYLFPREFKGAIELYNIDAIPSNPDYLIIMEGVFDVFGWYRAGIKNAIATFGKKISRAQVDMIRIVNPKAIFMAWDSDAYEKKHEFCELYGHYFPDIRIVDLSGKDADELSREVLLKALADAVPYSWDDKILKCLEK